MGKHLLATLLVAILGCPVAAQTISSNGYIDINYHNNGYVSECISQHARLNGFLVLRRDSQNHYTGIWSPSGWGGLGWTVDYLLSEIDEGTRINYTISVDDISYLYIRYDYVKDPHQAVNRAINSSFEAVSGAINHISTIRCSMDD